MARREICGEIRREERKVDRCWLCLLERLWRLSITRRYSDILLVSWIYNQSFGDNSLVKLVAGGGGPVGGRGKRDAISFLSSPNGFPLAVMKVSTSNGTLFRIVENEIYMILLFDICLISSAPFV